MKTETRKKLLIVLLAITLVAVWGQSFISKQTSETASDLIVDMIQPLEEIKPDPNATVPTVEYDFLNHLVRKGAHVLEYSIIGIELMLIFVAYSLERLLKASNRIDKEEKSGYLKESILKAHGICIINCILLGMVIGLIDETIQIFSERGSQIKDIWFDILGTFIGAGFIGILNILRLKRVSEKKR